MNLGPCNFVTLAAVCALLASVNTSSPLARCQSSSGWLGDIGPTKGQVAAVGAGIAAVGATVGVGVYYGVHRSHMLTGCAVSGANGIEVQNHHDRHIYVLVGEVADIKPGDRVRVSGKKERESSEAPRQFLVEKLQRDYGACTVEHAQIVR
jgi:hypothetical protein